MTGADGSSGRGAHGDLRCVSFYRANIPRLVVDSQAAVFRSLGLRHEQVESELPHGEAIDDYLRREDWVDVAIFDIDCIPLDLGFLDHFDPDGIVGGAQRAVHLSTEIYVSPAWIMFSRATWSMIGQPSFAESADADVGAGVSRRARERGVRVSTVWPTSVRRARWQLTDETWFGDGTTWGRVVYHQFEARHPSWSRVTFVRECRRISGARAGRARVVALAVSVLATSLRRSLVATRARRAGGGSIG